MFELNDIEMKKLLQNNVNLYVYVCGFNCKVIFVSEDNSLIGYMSPFDGNITKIKASDKYQLSVGV